MDEDIKAAFRSSNLSNRWSALWKSVPVLGFHRTQLESSHRLGEWVGKVLNLRNDSCNLRRLSLSLWDDVSIEPNVEELFERVMKYAASHGLQQLSVSRGHGRHYSEEIFIIRVSGLISNCHQSLEILKLTSFHLNAAAYSSWPGFKVLTTLTLEFCTFYYISDSENSIDPFGGFPCLKNLKLVRCDCAIGAVTLKISGLQLQKLEVVEVVFFSLVKVNAPKLESFVCWGDMMLPKVPKPNIPSLDHAYVRVAARYEETYLQLLGKEYMEWFRALYNTKSLTVHFDAIKMLSENLDLLESRVSPPFTRLMSLNVLQSEEVPEIPHRVMCYFMEGSPDMEAEQKIVVKFRKVAPPVFPYD